MKLLDEIARLQAQVRDLRAALKPCLEAFTISSCDCNNFDEYICMFCKQEYTPAYTKEEFIRKWDGGPRIIWERIRTDVPAEITHLEGCPVLRKDELLGEETSVVQ